MRCINLGLGVSKTVHFDQSEMRRMFFFVVVVFGKHQYRIFQPNISTEYSPMAKRTRRTENRRTAPNA